MLNTFIRLLIDADGKNNQELLSIIRAKLKNNKHVETKNTNLSKQNML